MSEKKLKEREIVIPGEVIATGDNYLPGDGTEKRGEEIVAIRYGLAEESNRLIKVILLSGVYQPRPGNVVVGKVENITYYGWVINIDSSENAFLPLQEVPRYIMKDSMSDLFEIGDMVVAKIFGMGGRGIDLTIKMKGLGKIDEGIIIKINPNKVPRVIGKEGSMINLIKKESGCDVVVGQNGLVWIKGNNVQDELKVKEVINLIVEKSLSEGLTEEVEEFFKKKK